MATNTNFKVKNGLDVAGNAIVIGDVGIGTTSPAGRLDIKGSGTTSGITLQTQNSAGTVGLQVLDNGNTTFSSTGTNTTTFLTTSANTSLCQIAEFRKTGLIANGATSQIGRINFSGNFKGTQYNCGFIRLQTQNLIDIIAKPSMMFGITSKTSGGEELTHTYLTLEDSTTTLAAGGDIEIGATNNLTLSGTNIYISTDPFGVGTSIDSSGYVLVGYDNSNGPYNLQVNSEIYTAGIAYSDGSSQNTAGYTGFRNRIINGDMRIDQRNYGSAVTVNVETTVFSVDRFFGYGYAFEGIFTLQQDSSAPAGFTNSLKATITTPARGLPNELYFLGQIIEGFNVADLGWGTANAETITVSFWVRCSLTGTFGGAVKNESTYSYPFSYIIDAANTWEKKTITIAGPTTGTWGKTNTAGMRLFWSLGVGSSFTGAGTDYWVSGDFFKPNGAINIIETNGATFYITGVQLEKGSVATPFEFRPYGLEKMLCERYYETSYPSNIAPGGSSDGSGSLTNVAINSVDFYTYGAFRYSVRKRVSPTVTFYNPVTGDVSKFRGISDSSNSANITAGFINDTGVGRVGCVSSNLTPGYVYAFHYTANAEL